MTMLTAHEVSVSHRELQILRHVSFEANGGDFVAIIGANGAGKSTLLSVLAGLRKPSLGMVSLNGTSLETLGRAALARHRAYLPQNPRCEWPISVERLVALGLTPVLPALGGLPKAYEPRIDAALAYCDLSAKRDQAATTLSGGELARAMLARALVADPDLLIVDEPTAGLDPRHALDAAAGLRALALQGKLVIAALHDLNLVARYATRILALRDGAVMAHGSIGDVLSSELLRALFDVEACVSQTSAGAFVDYLPLDRAPTSIT
jgi:iron complex transport system ATP-binding protein